MMNSLLAANASAPFFFLYVKFNLQDSEMDHIEKLGKLIQQLRLQEQGYVDLLQRTLVNTHLFHFSMRL